MSVIRTKLHSFRRLLAADNNQNWMGYNIKYWTGTIDGEGQPRQSMDGFVYLPSKVSFPLSPALLFPLPSISTSTSITTTALCIIHSIHHITFKGIFNMPSDQAYTYKSSGTNSQVCPARSALRFNSCHLPSSNHISLSTAI